MGYSDNPRMVRVDFFKTSGSYGYTEAVNMDDYFAPVIQRAFMSALIKHLKQPDGSIRLAGMTAVCLEPYHQHAYPLMLKVPDHA